MKISKAAILTLSCVFSMAGLGFLAVSASDRTLNADLTNIVQHIEKVILISTGNYEKRATITNIGGDLVGINTNNFILTKTGVDENEILDSTGSSVLGGIKNEIDGGLYNVILAGSGNKVEGSKFSTILGGESNVVSGSDSSAVLGGRDNLVKGIASVIPGGLANTVSGNYSVVVGNNSHVTGNNSIALGLKSNVNANNSFLWTDGEHGYEVLESDNVFSVMSSSGMLVNTDTANRLAKLTIGGPIIISSGENDGNIECNNGEGGGVLKVKSEGNKVCMCSCNGSGWSSLFGEGNCTSVCGEGIHPVCGMTVTKLCSGDQNYYTGSCNVGNVVEGTGAYLMDKNNILHWSCQTDDGQSVSCTGNVSGNGGCPFKADCTGNKPTGDKIMMGLSYYNSKFRNPTEWTYTNNENPSACEWTCSEGYKKNAAGTGCELGTYGCQGMQPSGAGVVTGSSTIQGNSNKNWTYTGSTNPGACEWTCTGGYVRNGPNGTGCSSIIYYCENDKPEPNKRYKFGNSWSLEESHHKNWRYIKDKEPEACEFKCNVEEGYEPATTRSHCMCKFEFYSDGILVKTYSDDCESNIGMYNGNGLNKEGYILVGWVSRTENGRFYETNASVSSIRENLKLDAVWLKEGTNEKVCTGTIPDGDGYKFGSGIYVGNEEKSWRYTSSLNPDPCEYTCDIASGYVLSGGKCVLDVRVCGGTQPQGDAYVLGGNEYKYGYSPTSWQYTDDESPNVCQYTCNIGAGYMWNGNICTKKESFLCSKVKEYKCEGISPSNTGYSNGRFTWSCGENQCYICDENNGYYEDDNGNCLTICPAPTITNVNLTGVYFNLNGIKPTTVFMFISESEQFDNGAAGSTTSPRPFPQNSPRKGYVKLQSVCSGNVYSEYSNIYEYDFRNPTTYPEMVIDNIINCNVYYHFNYNDPISNKSCCNPVILYKSYNNGSNWDMITNVYKNGMKVMKYGDEGNVYFRYTTDGGKTFSPNYSYNMSKQTRCNVKNGKQFYDGFCLDWVVNGLYLENGELLTTINNWYKDMGEGHYGVAVTYNGNIQDLQNGYFVGDHAEWLKLEAELVKKYGHQVDNVVVYVPGFDNNWDKFDLVYKNNSRYIKNKETHKGFLEGECEIK